MLQLTHPQTAADSDSGVTRGRASQPGLSLPRPPKDDEWTGGEDEARLGSRSGEEEAQLLERRRGPRWQGGFAVCVAAAEHGGGILPQRHLELVPGSLSHPD